MKDYKKILEGVVNIISTTEKSDIGFANIRTYLGENCPELLESEDEKIRKELLEHCKNQAKPYIQTGNKCPQIQSWITWLERQGEKPQGKSELEAIKEEKVDNQNCVNSADRIETTFHEGDWVVYNKDICKIVKREEGCNKLVTVFGIEKEFVNERNLSTARLWTISDAKDGDILVDEDNNIGIYQGKVDDVDWHSYIYLGCDNHLYGFYIGGYHSIKNTKPATKEQRDQFEKVMEEAEYEFDFKKKGLKKIEKKPEEKSIIISLKDFQEAFELKARQYDIELPNRGYDIHAMCKELYSLLIEQNPTWSEEDEKMIWAILLMIKSYPNQEMFYGYSKEKLISWLKSIKERAGCEVNCTTKKEWSEEDEKRVENLHGWLDTLINYIHHDAIVSLDLRRERMQQVEQLKTWLKSIRPQK